MTTYQPSETIVLKSTITRDFAADVENITATISIESSKGIVVSKAAMSYDLYASTSTSKVFYYNFTIPANVHGTVTWKVTVTNDLGYSRIQIGTFTVE